MRQFLQLGCYHSGVVPGTSVPLHSRRLARARLLQQLQHALPSLVLLMDGMQRFSAGARGVGLGLAVAEIALSVLVLAFFASKVTQHRASAAHPDVLPAVDWLDIALAAMFAVEALVRQNETGHLPRPTVLLAAIMLLLGLFHGPLMRFSERRRSLSLDDEGLRIGGRFFRRFTAGWREITAIEIDEHHARVMLKSGRSHRLNLTDLSNAAEVHAALTDARRRWRAIRDGTAAEVAPGRGSDVDRDAPPG